MVVRDSEWSEKRRQSSRALAFYCEREGITWTSIREAVNVIAPALGVVMTKKRRSHLAIECMDILSERGITPPPGYVPPWQRPDYQSWIVRR